MRDGHLRSGELARLADLSTDTLRHYERVGVLPAPERSANGYRRYPPEALERVTTVQAALAIGFTLEELAAIFRARSEGRPPCREVRDLTAAKLAHAEDQLQELVALVETLRTVLADWDARLAAAPTGASVRLLEGLVSAAPASRRRSHPRQKRTAARPRREVP